MIFEGSSPKNSQRSKMAPQIRIELNALKSLIRFDTPNSKRFVFQNTVSNGSRHFSERNQNPLKPSKFNLDKKDKKRNLYDVISIFYLIRKFINILNIAIMRKPKFLSQHQFELIGDKSLDFSTISNSGIFQKKKKNFSFFLCLRKTGITPLHPFSKFIMFWSIIHLILFFCVFFIIPINISFGVNFLDQELGLSQTTKQFLKAFIIAFYLIDIIMNFYLSYYENGELICDPYKIMIRYMMKMVNLFVILIKL